MELLAVANYTVNLISFYCLSLSSGGGLTQWDARRPLTRRYVHRQNSYKGGHSLLTSYLPPGEGGGEGGGGTMIETQPQPLSSQVLVAALTSGETG